MYCICIYYTDQTSEIHVKWHWHTGNVDIKRAVWARFASVFRWFYCFAFNFFLPYLSMFFTLYPVLLCFFRFCAAIWHNKERIGIRIQTNLLVEICVQQMQILIIFVTSGTVFYSLSHLLRHLPSSALAWRHTSSNAVSRNYCCRTRKVTLSFMEMLIALT